ncbi:MAG: long-chain fatty acid--CoA ligase [Novosphingobium sp.]|nr:long-chain fatty acid--CoA ligase [Novosphingobium sp.]
MAATLPDLPLPALVLRHGAEHGGEVAICQKRGDAWQDLTWAGYAARVKACAAGLAGLGLTDPVHTAILADNSADWLVAQMATGLIGGVPLGCYPTSSTPDLLHALGHADVQVLFCQDDAFLAKVLPIRDQLPLLRWIVMFDPESEALSSSNVIALAELEQQGAEALTGDPALLDARIDALSLDQVGLIVYTSGSTGAPKAAMLTYGNMRAAASGFVELLGYRPGARYLSYLPLCHIAEQAMTNFGPLYTRATAAIGSGLPSLIEDMQAIRPTYFSGVPRVWLRFEEAIRESDKSGKDALTVVGLDQTEVATSGAASLPVETLNFFRSLGLELLELYGMTENCSIMTIHRHGRVVPGTVGEPLDTVDLKIADDGEILVRGPSVFAGYYKNPEASAEAVVDGWLHTGDLGVIEDGELRIVDRKKDLMITDGGKNIAPAEIEALMRTSPLIAEFVLVAEGRKYVTALVQPDPAGFGAKDYAALIAEPETQDRLAAEVRRLNDDLPRVAQVKRLHVLTQPLAHGEGELTPTLKLRRFKVHQRYAEEIEAIYAGSLGFDVSPRRP